MGRHIDTSVRLVDQVIPQVPVRQWVLSLPPALRYLFAYDPELATAMLSIFTSAVFAWLERTARAQGDIPDDASVYCGSVTAIHRSDSAGKLNWHPHTLALDGVYVLEPSDNPDSAPQLRFVSTPAPSKPEVSAVAWEVCERTMKLLKAKGLALDATPEELVLDYGQGTLLSDPMLAQCGSASMRGVVLLGPRAGRQVLRLGTGPNDTDSRGRAAHGFDLHAGRRISARDRKGLERLCRYILRPPISHDRVELTGDGKVRLRLKRAWSDGTSHLVFTPLDFIARLVPLVPPPKTHRVRYHGVLASHHKLRSSVVPEPPEDTEPKQHSLFNRRQAEHGPLAPAPKHRIEWHKLMARTLNIDPLRCPKCAGSMRIEDFITSPRRIQAVLRRNGLWQELARSNLPRGPPQLELPFRVRAAAA